MHKQHQRGDNSKGIKVRALILYATHRHNQFYITVKYHQNIPNGIRVIERTRKCLRTDGRTGGWMDARLIAMSPEPFGRGIKIHSVFAKYLHSKCFTETSYSKQLAPNVDFIPITTSSHPRSVTSK